MVNNHCTIKYLLTLGIKDVNDHIGVLALILPFANEFANLANIAFFKPLFKKNIYPHHDSPSRLFYDVLALIGIALNVSRYTQATNDWRKGFGKGIVYLLFAFALPNMTMHHILDFFTTNHYLKGFIGLIAIYIIELLIHKTICIFDSYLDDNFPNETSLDH